MKKALRLVTRRSALAMWQAQYVAQQLSAIFTDLDINIIGMATEGDKILDKPLTKVGGKGLFVKELENALLNYEADIAVHSLKDMPAECPAGLEIAAILEREDPREALVCLRDFKLNNLPANAIVGTSSLRRQSQVLAIRPDLKLKNLRGNIDTRIQKLINGEYDAMLLAVAGLKRLGLQHYIQEYLATETILPAVAQGALAIECRSSLISFSNSQPKKINNSQAQHNLSNDEITTIVQKLHHLPTAQCVLAERQMNALLDGGCQLPTAGYATLHAEGKLYLRGKVMNEEGSICLMAEATGNAADYLEIGNQVGSELIRQGAKKLLNLITVMG